MAKKKFKEVTVSGEAPEELFKPTTGSTYYMRVVNDIFYEWDEMWPTFHTSKGLMKRRYVASEDGKNFVALDRYRENADIAESDSGNWKLKKQYGMFIILGKPQKKKVNGKVRTKVVWDKDEILFWTFGIKVYRQLKSINQDDEYRETAEEKGIDMENIDVMQVFSIKMVKEKTGSENYNVEYNLSIHKCLGQLTDISTEDVEVKIDAYTNPSPKSDVDEFVSRNAGGLDEAESEIEEEEDDEPAPKKKKKPVVVDEDEEEDEEEDDEPAPKKKAKKKKPVVVDEDEEDEEIDPDDDEEDE